MVDCGDALWAMRLGTEQLISSNVHPTDPMPQSALESKAYSQKSQMTVRWTGKIKARLYLKSETLFDHNHLIYRFLNGQSI